MNPEVTESKLERWSPEKLKDHIATAGVRVEPDRDAWTRLAFTGAARRSLVLPLLVAALLLLGAETLVSATSRSTT